MNKKEKMAKVTRSHPILAANELLKRKDPQTAQSVDFLYLDFCCFLLLTLFAQFTKDMSTEEKEDKVKKIISGWKKQAKKKYSLSLSNVNSFFSEIIEKGELPPDDFLFDIEAMHRNFGDLVEGYSGILGKLFGLKVDEKGGDGEEAKE